jgi:Zn-dependent protease with chaperone function
VSNDRVPQTLSAEYFDGRSARAHPVQLRRDGELLRIAGADVELGVPLRQVQWPERTRHGTRVAHLPGGGSLHCADAAAWDAFARECGRGDSIVVRAQQSWRWVLGSVAAMVVLLGAFYQWGLPLAARAVVPLIPHSVDAAIGESALASLDEHLLEPSKLPPEQQQRLHTAFERALAAQPSGSVPAHQVLFRSGEIGPNAFALPGGTMVVTDELVELVGGDEAVVIGVLGHELGHVRHRHGLRLLVQASAIGVVASAVLGDFSSLLTAVPVWLGQAAYARDAEREADAEAARILRDAGLSPAVMVTFFEKVAARGERKRAAKDTKGDPKSETKDSAAPRGADEKRDRAPSWLGIAIASHPADAERIRFFQDAAAARR